jgi:hypothetical protein
VKGLNRSGCARFTLQHGYDDDDNDDDVALLTRLLDTGDEGDGRGERMRDGRALSLMHAYNYRGDVLFGARPLRRNMWIFLHAFGRKCLLDRTRVWAGVCCLDWV